MPYPKANTDVVNASGNETAQRIILDSIFRFPEEKHNPAFISAQTFSIFWQQLVQFLLANTCIASAKINFTLAESHFSTSNRDFPPRLGYRIYTRGFIFITISEKHVGQCKPRIRVFQNLIVEISHSKKGTLNKLTKKLKKVEQTRRNFGVVGSRSDY